MGGRRIASSTRGGGGINMYNEVVFIFRKFSEFLEFFLLQFVGELIEYKPKVVKDGSRRLETSALGLTFAVKPKYVNLGLKLECTASIGSVYWQSFQETPKVSPREQPAVSGNWWTSSSSAASGSTLLLFRWHKKNPMTCFFSLQFVEFFHHCSRRHRAVSLGPRLIRQQQQYSFVKT